MTDQHQYQETQSINIISYTKELIKNMSHQQRIIKAQHHLNDALSSFSLRVYSCYSGQSQCYYFFYAFYHSYLFTLLLQITAYTFMYLVILDKEHYNSKIIIESCCITLFWIQLIIKSYCQKCQISQSKRSYFKRNGLKIALLLLMSADLIIFIIRMQTEAGRPIRPFRILRGLIPILYHKQIRNSFISLVSTFLNLLAFYILYSFVVVFSGIIGSQLFTMQPQLASTPQNYNELSKMIFIMYVCRSYDSYPNNQLIAFSQSKWNNMFQILYIFINLFFFASIPGSIVYNKFRQTRAKIILQNQLIQQQSLIIAYVTLMDEQNSLSINRFIQFLVFIYKKQIRFVQHIADICLQVCKDRNTIPINQFIHLGKIMMRNAYRLPPPITDLMWWIKLRKYLNQTLCLQYIVSHIFFQISVTIMIILCFINTIFLIYEQFLINDTLDTVFLVFFVIELLIRILGLGLQNYFADPWNYIDCFIVLVNLIMEISLLSNQSSFLKIVKILRLSNLLKILSHISYIRSLNFSFIVIISKLLRFSLILVPIIIKYISIFLIIFYFLGIICMQLFYETERLQPSSYPDSFDAQSNFKHFIGSQFVLTQILTQTNWSYITLEHAQKNQKYYGLIVFFFCFMHINIVFIFSSLVKGIYWQIYQLISSKYEMRQAKSFQQIAVDEQIIKKQLQYNVVLTEIKLMKQVNPNTILKKQIYQKKIDKIILNNLAQIFFKQLNINLRRSSISLKLQSMKTLIEHTAQINRIQSIGSLKHIKIEISKLDSLNHLLNKDIIQRKDFQDQLDHIVNNILTNHRVKYFQITANPKIFTDFIQNSFESIQNISLIQSTQFDQNKQSISSPQSIIYHLNEMKELLQMVPSKRQKKALILSYLINEKIIDVNAGEQLLHKRLMEKMFRIDSEGAIRNVFLNGTDQNIINKIETQYFSQQYGSYFDSMSKVSIQPLIRLQSNIVFALKNILRYPQIKSTQFFELLLNIQNLMSSKLLRKGSLVKLIYKIDIQNQIWFTIQHRQEKILHIHFLKSGIWLYNENMKQEQIYYSKDLFNYNVDAHSNQNLPQYLQKLYANIVSLAFSLPENDHFFKTNPKESIYDLYYFVTDATKIKRYIKQKLQISKIMLFVFSFEGTRNCDSYLTYKVSDIQLQQKQTSRKDISQKLQQVQQLPDSYQKKMIEIQGLPYLYTINLMQQIMQTLSLHSKNLIFQVERAFNRQISKLLEQDFT